MGRTKLSSARKQDFKDLYIGQIIVFYEGQTEKYYFDYFAEIVNSSSKYADIRVEIENAQGNARTVLNHASQYMDIARNHQKYQNYSKYLVFDCDDPPDIQNIILEANSSRFDFVLLVSNRVFETWLLMHFEEIDHPMGKSELYRHLENHLHGKKYRKGQKGIIREIIQNGDIERAIKNGKVLHERYDSEGLQLSAHISKMNPYTNIYQLVEQLLIAIS